MLGNLSKKTIAVGVLITVLLATAVAGTVIFLKDSGEATAAMQEKQNVLPVTGENNNDIEEIDSENTGDSLENETNTEITNDTYIPTVSTEELPEAGTEIIERKISEDLQLSWTTIAIPAITADMGIYKPKLNIEKTAIAVTTAEGITTESSQNGLPEVRVGDIITYKISVSNTGNYKATNVIVTDSLNVIFDSKTVEAGDELLKLEKLNSGEKVELQVAYTVTQDDIANDKITNIENKAFVTDGKTTVEDKDDTVKKEPRYKITYLYEGDIPSDATNLPTEQPKYYVGETVEVIETTATGYTFSGWTSEDVTVETDGKFTMPAKDIILKGSFTKKAEPKLKLTKTALNNNKENISNFVYNPNVKNTFIYRLRLENKVKDSYPINIAEEIVVDILPVGIKVDLTQDELQDLNIVKETVVIDEKNREKLTWTANNIGYGDKAVTVDIPVKIELEVFTGQEINLGTGYNVLDLTFSQGFNDIYLNANNQQVSYGVTDTDNSNVNLFIRGIDNTVGDKGFIYAGSVNTKKTFSSQGNIKWADNSCNYNVITAAVGDASKLAQVCDTLVSANADTSNTSISSYVQGGLPTKATINANLNALYDGKVQLSDTQVVLWYSYHYPSDMSRLKRNYIIKDGATEIFNKWVLIPETRHHLDGIVVDITSLGENIPTGAQVKVTNTVSVEKNILSDDSQTSCLLNIFYKTMPTLSRSRILAKSRTNLLTSIINDENINTETIESLANAIEDVDNKNNDIQENVDGLKEDENEEDSINLEEDIKNKNPVIPDENLKDKLEADKPVILEETLDDNVEENIEESTKESEESLKQEEINIEENIEE